MKFYWYLVFSTLLCACATKYPVYVGDTMVVIKTQQKGEGKHFVHLHQNEKTALKAAKIVMAQQGGSYLTLVHRGQRNIIFNLSNQRYEFDPNRIFTAAGIKKTLTEFGNYTPAAYREVKKLADTIKLLIPPGKIVAVHNNQSYSFKNYLPKNELSVQALSLNFSDPGNYRNFYLLTNRKDYERLKALNFNSILQAPHASNDGSLSIYLARRHYINVEAGYDQLRAQIKMLKCA